MGIQGLLPLLKSIMSPVHVEELRGCKVAVDTYSWLHKGALACSADLCKGIPTSRHIDYCMHRVNLLRHYGLKPILIFDGGFLPMKDDQETKRARVRKENLERAKEHESNGNSTSAFECYQKAVDISPSIAHELIQVLKKEKVDYIVAPYEADAQMTYMSVNKFVDAVITEDSDLIPFGCSRIIFKMDKFGQGVEYKRSMLEKNKDLDFNGFSGRMLLEMCILSGCDYLQSLPGMGLKRAHALVQKFKSYDKVIKHLRYSSIAVPPLYEDSFKKAIWAFQHQRVYDPVKEDIVHLSDIPEDLGNDLDFLGPWLPQEVAKGIATGNLDPFTKMPFQDNGTLVASVNMKPYVGKEHLSTSEKKRLDLPVQKNILTNYFCLASLEAKRKFRAPKVVTHKKVEAAESPSPGCDSHSSKLQASPKEATLCMNINCQDSFLVSESIHDSPEDMIKDVLTPEPDNELPSFESTPTSGDPCSTEQPCRMLSSKGKTSRTSAEFEMEDSCVSLSMPKTISAYRKVTVKSSYFKDKSSAEDGYCKENGQPAVGKGDASGLIDHCLMSKGASVCNGFQKCPMKKRKLNDETLPLKKVQTPPLLEEGIDPCNLECADNNGKNEAKFVCNISHLTNYNTIAEKSMERFVTLMSSFRYTGSRASGLRPPLKDVQNTCSVRNAS